MSNYVEMQIANAALTNELRVEDTHDSDVLTKAQISDLFSTETFRIIGAGEGDPNFTIFENIKDLSTFFHETNSDVYDETKKLLDDTDGELTQEGADVVTLIGNNNTDTSDDIFDLDSDSKYMSTERTDKLDDLLTTMGNMETGRDGDNTQLVADISNLFSDIVFDRSTLSTSFYAKEDKLKGDMESLSGDIYDAYSEHSYEAYEMNQKLQAHVANAQISEGTLTTTLGQISTDDYQLYSSVSTNLFTEEIRNEQEFDSLSNRLVSVEKIETDEINNLVGKINGQKGETNSVLMHCRQICMIIQKHSQKIFLI